MEERRVEPDEALRILEAVGGALDHAHANGVVHRDVRISTVARHTDGVDRCRGTVEVRRTGRRWRMGLPSVSC